jgi:hypothetical protein
VEFGEMTFYMRLQPIEQFEIVAMIAGMCLFFSVILMELFKDRDIRIAARALGMIGVVVLGAFGFRMASQCQRLENQIAMRAVEVSQHQSSNIVLRTPKGYEFSPGVLFDGVRTGITGIRGCYRPTGRSDDFLRINRSGIAASAVGSSSGTDASEHGFHIARRLLESTARWAGSGWAGRNAAEF